MKSSQQPQTAFISPKLLRNTVLTGISSVLFIMFLLPAFSCSSFGGTNKSVSVEQAKKMLDSSTTVIVLDVRTKEEFTSETGHLKNAVHIPVQELENRINELAPFKKQTILVYCRSGVRSKRASDMLGQKGFMPINMEGGIIEWNQAHFPVER